jgi:hypothetical protein
MVTTITTYTGRAFGDFYETTRPVAFDSDGNAWVASHNPGATRIEFWYAPAPYTSWTEATSLRIASATSWDSWAFDIHPAGDIACVMPGDTSDLYVCQGLTPTSTWTQVTGAQANGDNEPCDVVVFPDPANSSFFYVAGAWELFGGGQDLSVWRIDKSDNTLDSTPVDASSLSTRRGRGVGIDFNHTGDGATIAGGVPHLWMASADDESSPENMNLAKWNYSGGSWSRAALRALTSQASVTGRASLASDGARIISTTSGEIFQRDVADTTTVDLSADRTGNNLSWSANSSTVADEVVFVDGDTGDVYLVGMNNDDDLYWIKYDRATDSWDASWTLLNTGTTDSDHWGTTRRSYGSRGLVVWLEDTGADIALMSEPISWNAAPLAPTWATPEDNAVRDETATLPVSWVFNDPDDGDTQSAYALKRTIGGTTTYYNAAAGTWSGTEVKNTSTTEGVTLPATWGADGDVVGLAVKTWDAIDTEGVYGATLTVTGSTKVNPTLTAPTDAGTITTSRVTATWTATEQTAYRLRVLTSADVVLYDSGKVTSTIKTVEAPVDLADGLTGAKVEVRAWNNDDLESSTDTHTFTVDFVEPATPTYELSVSTNGGFIQLDITDPTPTGSQPTVTAHDVYVRVAAGGRQDGERPVGGDGIRIAADITTPFLDYAAASGIDYEYRTLAKADNGTSVFGAWYSDSTPIDIDVYVDTY